MEWIAAAIVFVALLYLFPRAVGATLALAVVISLGIGAFFWWQSFVDQRAAAQVMPTFEVDVGASRCRPEFPVYLGFVNNSGRTVRSIDFGVIIRRKGYSNAIGSFISLTQDKILTPGEGFGFCYAMPTLSVATTPGELEFEPSFKSVRWD